MRTLRQMGLRLAARAGIGMARRRVVRSRSLRWAVRVPLVTMAMLAVAALLVAGDRARR